MWAKSIPWGLVSEHVLIFQLFLESTPFRCNATQPDSSFILAPFQLKLALLPRIWLVNTVEMVP